MDYIQVPSHSPDEEVNEGISSALSLPAVEPPDPDFEKKIYICSPCLEARRDRQYQARVAILLRPIFCSTCKIHRAAIFFTYQQRYQKAPQCIRHEAYRTICPHIRIRLSEIQHLQGQTLACQEQECLWKSIRVSFTKDIVEYEYNVIEPQHLPCPRKYANSSVPKLSLRILAAAHDSEPTIFCTHVRAMPDLFFTRQMAYLADARKYTWMEGTLCNFGCLMLLRWDQQDHNNCVIYKGKINPSEKGSPMEQHWYTDWDAESIGLFNDPEFMNVVWCNNVQCSTSRGLARYNAVQKRALFLDYRNEVFSMTEAHGYWKHVDERTLMYLEGWMEMT